MCVIFARYRHRRSLLSAIVGDFRGGLYLRVPSPEVLDAVYRRPCSCASIRHHARSSFANSGKFTKFKCKIGRCSAGSMEARARRRRGREGEEGDVREERRGTRKAKQREYERQKDRYGNEKRTSEKGVSEKWRAEGTERKQRGWDGKRRAKGLSENGIYIDRYIEER